MKRIIQLVLPLLILIMGFCYFSQKGHELKQLLQVTSAQLAASSLAILTCNVIAGMKLRQMVLSQNVLLTPGEWFGLPNVRKLGNLIFFKSGTASNAYYLKTKRSLSYSKFVVIFAAEKVTDLYAHALMGLIVSLFFVAYHGWEFYIVYFFICLSGFLTYFLFFCNWQIPEYRLRLLKIAHRLLDLWRGFKNDGSSVYRLIFLGAAAIPFFSLRLFIAFSILHEPARFMDCLVMALAVGLSGVINLAPGGLGIREGAVGLAATYMGRGFDYGVIAAAFDRVLATLWFGILGFIFFHVLSFSRFEKKSEILSAVE